MLFTEFRFLIFFALVWLIYWKLTANTARKILLTVASCLFYGAWDYRFLGLILLTILIDYFVAIRIETSTHYRQRRVWLGVSLLSNLGILCFFKYFNFFTSSLAILLDSLGIAVRHTTLDIILPVGISFYTFQTLSYTIDVYKGLIKAQQRVLDVALYVTFFPQLVAGPIVRAKDFLPQLETLRAFHSIAFKSLLTLFLVGFFKKSCIADNFAPFVDMVFKTPTDYSAMAIFSAVLLYSVQIYCDFSGYSDMAIATAGLLGYSLPINFQTPYLASNPTNFWQRWHISLSTWLRDYLYIPLGGSRNGRRLQYRNLMMTMLLGGLWHGAAWTFILWGFLHGLALILHKHWLFLREKTGWLPSLPTFATLLATYYWVCFTWIFFRAENLEQALPIVRAFVFLESTGHKPLDVNAPLLLALFFLAQWMKNRLYGKIAWERIPDWIFALSLGCASAISVGLIASSGYVPFIYFQF